MTYYVKIRQNHAVANYTINLVSYGEWELGVEDIGVLMDTGMRDTFLSSYFKGEVLKLQVI